MKRLLTGALALILSLSASATTLNPIQLLNPAGSSSGQAIVSTGASSAPSWQGVALLTGATFTGPLSTNSTVAAAQTGVFTNTQMNVPYTFLLNGLSPTTEYTTEQGSNYDTESHTSGVAVPSSSTVHQATAVAGYVNNASTTTNAVGGYFSARSLAANTKNWSINTVIDDGSFASTILGYEMDVGVKNASSTVNGLAVTGVFQNLNPAASVGVQVGTLLPATNTGQWAKAFLTTDGASPTALLVGAAASVAANVDGQLITFNTYDATSTLRQPSIQAVHQPASANLNINIPTNGVLFVGGGFGIQTNGFLKPSSTAGLVGTVTNDNANAGSVGEYQTATTSGVSLTSGTTANATSVSLTAGDWDVSCNAQFVPASTTTVSQIAASINTTSATLGGGANGLFYSNLTYAAGPTPEYVNTGVVRESLAATTTVYCAAQSSFATSTMTVTGIIRARRIR